MTSGSESMPKITMETSAAMAALLASHPGAVEIFVPSPFRLLVFGGFKEVDRCVFFRELFPQNRVDESVLARHQDRTGVECTVNKIHLEDFLEKGMAREAPSLALIAVECAKFLAGHLHKKLAGYSFRIIVSVDDRVCTMRFHKLRDGEVWFRDINATEEALLVMEVTPYHESREPN